MHSALSSFCRAIGTRQPWQGLAKLAGLGLLVGGMVWVAAQSQVTTPIGSFLELGGQVTGPATSPTLNSTLDLSGNDQVRWTSYFQSKLDGPFEAEGVLDIPPGHTWRAGSVRKPAGTSIKFQVNGAWQDIEPASGTRVAAVKWRQGPLYTGSTPNLSPSAEWPGNITRVMRDLPGGITRPIVLGQNIFFFVQPFGITCRVASTGAVCPGYSSTWANDLKPLYPEITQGIGAFQVGAKEASNPETGEIFMHATWMPARVGGLYDKRPAYVICYNTKTGGSCGSWPMGSATGGWDSAPQMTVSTAEQIGEEYFMMREDDTLLCFNIKAKQNCGETKYPGMSRLTTRAPGSAPGGPSYYGNIKAASTVLDGKMFMTITWMFNVGTYCHDPKLRGPCTGWPAAGIQAAVGPLVHQINPILDDKGMVIGVCTLRCYGMQGQVIPWQRSGGSSGTQVIDVEAVIKGSRIYGASAQNVTGGGTVQCIDYALPSDPFRPYCDGKFTTGTQVTNTYYPQHVIRFDPTRPGCLMALTNSGTLESYNPDTGGDCTPGGGGSNGGTSHKVDIHALPQTAYQCDTARNRVLGWSAIRLSPTLPWGGANGLDRVTVTLKDANGANLPAALHPVRQLPVGQYQLSISDIPYASYPKLSASIEFHSPGTLPANTAFAVDVTWDGDPMQVCVGTQAPASPDCQTGATLTVNSSKIDSTSGTFKETLVASKVLSPGGLSSGFSAMASPTSQRAVLSDKGPRDPKTSVVQGRWALQQFSGDLWAFGLTPTGQIDSSGYLSAQAATAAPDARPMFTAGVAANGVQPVQPLTWANLSAGQQAALNQSLSGQADTLGAARLAYLRGSDGGFRPRGGKSLGPVINSSPAVLLPTATLSLNERSYPGYTAYRAAVTRPHPIALFGGNDGALHAYEVRSGELREAWSFVPDVMLRRAANYADADMAGIRANPYFVDNIPMVGHVNAGAALGWRAVAVMTYGRGARAITALDVTKADLGQGAGVLFEYSNVSDPALKDLGYIISQPLSNNALVSQQLVQLAHGTGAHAGRRSAVLVGNGIHSNDGSGGAAASGTGKAVLYAFYLDQGGAERWQRWAVDELWAGAASEPGLSVNNGLSTPTPVDVDGDGRIDLVYAGDLQGNVWRFDVRNPAAARVTRLFKTEAQQPVTQAPFVTANPLAAGCGAAGADAEAGAAAKRCWQVVFSTGAAISPLQGSANVATQSIYGVLDKGTGATVARGQLTSLPFALNQVVNGVEYRALQPTTVDYQGGALGWVLDLQAFEHGVGAPRVQPTGLVMFSSVRPVTPDRAVNVCIGPRSWLNEVDPLHGYSALVPFDINGDGQINAQDRLNPDSAQALSPAGMAVSGGQFGPPAVLQAASTQAQQMSLLLPSLGQDTGQANSWSGGPGQGGGSSPAPGSNSTALTHAKPAKLGRMTWREIY